MQRTFPENIYFKPKTKDVPPAPFDNPDPLVDCLRRVLVAFSFHNPEIGYCQSLNFIVGLLLLFFPEEEAFWMLVVITEDLLPVGMYSKSLSGALTEMSVFRSIVKKKCKSVVKKVAKGNMIELDALISPWFMTIYINVLPIESVLRVWDSFF